ALVACLLMIAACARLGAHAGLTYPHIAKKALLVALIIQGAAYYAGLYDLHAAQLPRDIYKRILQALAVGSVLLWGVFYVVRPLRHRGEVRGEARARRVPRSPRHAARRAAPRGEVPRRRGRGGRLLLRAHDRQDLRARAQTEPADLRRGLHLAPDDASFEAHP